MASNEERSRKPAILFVQDAFRLHYALPLALEKAGMLERMVTDLYCPPDSWEDLAATLVSWTRPAAAARIRARRSVELPAARVDRSAAAWLAMAWAQRFRGLTASYSAMSQSLAKRIRRRGWGKANGLMGFIRHLDPDLVAEARQRGLVIIGNQMIAPAKIERAEYHRQRERFHQWEPANPSIEEYFDYSERAETLTVPHLDLITCPSDYVRQGLMEQGVDPSRLALHPYPIDVRQWQPVDRRNRTGPITVGFVGQVSLRKGAPYFFEVAKRLDPRVARFVMVGPLLVNPRAFEDLGDAVKVVGSVPSDEAKRWLERFDVVYFPSTCEGSSGALMEAMALGLPMVTSPNSGSVVRDGVEGYLCPYDQVEVAAERLHRLATDAELRHSMGESARRRAEEFSVDACSRRLASELQRLFVASTQ